VGWKAQSSTPEELTTCELENSSSSANSMSMP
jgi:hypothetical protein